MPDNPAGYRHVVRCDNHTKPGKMAVGLFRVHNAHLFSHSKHYIIQRMIENMIKQITEDLKEIKGLLEERSRELDRRARFDEELGKEIEELKRRYNGNRHTRTEPDDS